MKLTIDQINFIYNLAYSAGHNDTVEGSYVHIVHEDLDDYHRDIVEELLEEMDINAED